MFPAERGFSLNKCLERFGIALEVGEHRALAGAGRCRDLFYALGEEQARRHDSRVSRRVAEWLDDSNDGLANEIRSMKWKQHNQEK
jgi:hypothetical protein